MNKHLAAALTAGAVGVAGFTGFTITSALAEDDGAAEPTQVQLEEGEEGRRGNREAKAQALADIIGISVDDLMAARADGQTPAEIAEANDVSRDDLVSALVDAKQERLDEAVAAGDLTEAEADEKAADLEERVSAFVDGEGRPDRPGRGPDGPADGPEDGAPDEGDAPADDEEADA